MFEQSKDAREGAKDMQNANEKGVAKLKVTLGIALMGLFVGVGTVHADTIIRAVTNQAAFGNGHIESWDLDLNTGTATAAGSFIPVGAILGGINGATPNGRGIAVTNTQFYYTELSGGGFGPTLSIESGLYNGGAGGPDNGNIANPTPGLGVAVLEFANDGNLYALAGYPNLGPEVFKFDPATGKILAGPVTIANGGEPAADGFTVLPNGNYLINRGDAVNSYDQYDPVTGLRIAGTNIFAPNCGSSTGVTTDGSHLFFNCNLSSIEETDLNGILIHNFTLPGSLGNHEDISLVANFNPPPPLQTPEPGTLGLLGVGLAWLFAARKRFF
jgi:hypothetical protein